ncbi:hypothetical protein SKAU_G00091370 [Synaphobranchus kaupii]|uniref:Dystrophia myotonica WD repeat-containing protein n=1 Tax=Synaphobranchus kaupii TaxID=118154 RepID=A0A9Q1J668_SYNKA|nr:hypothetical protein SKAU_G00091370 [Synaphobranchus kaupii]
MAGDGGALKDINEIKSQFRTREGFYKLLTLSDSQQRGGITRGPSTSAAVGPGAGAGSIPGGGGGGSVQGPGSASSATAAANSSPAGFLPPVRVSMVKLQPEDPSEESERVCFNIGRELYFYTYTNIKKAVDLSKPIDKRIYKGTQPTCHDFNQYSATADSVSLIVGFSAGQVQYLDPIKKETSKLFNEERLIDKVQGDLPEVAPQVGRTCSWHRMPVGICTCTMWSTPAARRMPQYTLLRQGEGFRRIRPARPRRRATRCCAGRWARGGSTSSPFSPDGVHVACVGQDGCLRVFHFDSMELQGVMKSYFGGLLCVSWSPDGKYLATGGEDDLVTVWSFAESRVVAPRSWSQVLGQRGSLRPLHHQPGGRGAHGAERQRGGPAGGAPLWAGAHEQHPVPALSRHSSKGGATSVTYRFGSVGQDTQFCLWDLTDDVLYPRLPLSRALTNTFGSAIPPSPTPPRARGAQKGAPAEAAGACPSASARFATLTLQERKSDKSGGGRAAGEEGENKEHKHYHSLGNISKSNDKINVVPRNSRLDAAKVLGTTLCPRMHEVPLLEPLVCKKIAHERLTVLVFMDDCIITACQEGLICTWARPGKACECSTSVESVSQLDGTEWELSQWHGGIAGGWSSDPAPPPGRSQMCEYANKPPGQRPHGVAAYPFRPPSPPPFFHCFFHSSER